MTDTEKAFKILTYGACEHCGAVNDPDYFAIRHKIDCPNSINEIMKKELGHEMADQIDADIADFLFGNIDE